MIADTVQIFAAIAAVAPAVISLNDRRAGLLDAIKTETRWQTLAGTAETPFNAALYAELRKAFVRNAANVRAGRVSEGELAWFYDLVADNATTFSRLIAMRKARHEVSA